jgi:hypothetical protein
LEVGFYLVATHVGVLLILCTMRQGNGYRGPHELLSGTRVVRVTSPQRPERIRITPTKPASAIVDEPSADLPRRLGPYEVQDVLPGAEGADQLLGEDVALGRRVLLARRPKGEEGLSLTRKAVSRMTRPRWLSSGTANGEQWHAFVAPDQGWSLPRLLDLCPPLPWRETRSLLQQLVEELTAALAYGTLPEHLTVDQVWVQPDGKLLLLDWPIRRAQQPDPAAAAFAEAITSEPPKVETVKKPEPAPSQEERALALLCEIAVLTLQGKPRPRGGGPFPVRARLPIHAAAMMARLVGAENPYRRLCEFQADLDATRGKAVEINWVRLLVYVSVETALLYTGIMYLPMLFLLTKERDPTANDGCAAFQALMALLGGLFYSLLICPPLAILIAVLLRGGFSFYLTDMALLTWNGQRAPRWRCGLRALLTWVQVVLVTGLPAVTTFLLVKFPYPIHMSWGAIVLYFHLLAYALIGEALVSWWPRRSLPDRLCGTYLVPK